MLSVNNPTESQLDVIKQLQKLNEWQEEQKQILQERQNAQRQLLGLQQQNMYQMLGLSQSAAEEEAPTSPEESVKGEDKKTNGKSKLVVHIETPVADISSEGDDEEEEAEAEEEWADDGKDEFAGAVQMAVALTSHKTHSGTAEVPTSDPQKPKRKFLKRGEGLKERFKIDPESLRINNLPRYKYANAHTRYKTVLKKNKPNIIAPQPQEAVGQNEDASKNALDAQEKRFQQLLISSDQMCNSTPDPKCSRTSLLPSKQCKVRFAGLKEAQSDTALTQASCSLQKILWSKVLDPQQIKAIPVRDSHSNNNEELINQKEDESLNIFELLEQKAKDGSINMNSSGIKQLMEEKLRANETDEISVDKRMKLVRLEPSVSEVFTVDYSDSDGDNDPTETKEDSEYLDSSEDPIHSPKTQVRVRFAKDLDNTDTTSEMSVTDDHTNAETLDLFERFKESLFTVLQTKINQGDDSATFCSSNNPNESTLTGSATSMASEDLQEKTNSIKTRLEQLEVEINSFKENNLELMKAKQQHELEIAEFTQERLETMERLKDEKIQIEIYLHDERMKIEDDKRKFEQKIRNSQLNRKERQEIARLKQELEEAQLVLKQKEQTHASAQARLRAQIRNLEKDQKQMQNEIEHLTRENKKLQNENVRIARDNNNKMLHEINRNIAKLAAPKVNPVEGEGARRVRSLTATTNSKATARKSPQTQAQKSSKKLLSAGASSKSIHNRKNSLNMHRHEASSSEADASLSFTEDTNALDAGKCNKADYDTNEDDDAEICQELAHNTKEVAQKPNKQEHENSNNTSEFKREIINADGSKDIWYPNGNLKKISADAMIIRMLYFNKDIKETNINEGTVKYYYAGTNTWHTTYLDGLEILEFPNGQTERRYKNGKVEVHFPNNSIKVMDPTDENKVEEWTFADGTNLLQLRNGDKIILLPNGQKEVHTDLCKRREYPDGTVKLVYPDGSQETRYSNGRVRLRDKDGKLVMDTDNNVQ